MISGLLTRTLLARPMTICKSSSSTEYSEFEGLSKNEYRGLDLVGEIGFCLGFSLIPKSSAKVEASVFAGILDFPACSTDIGIIESVNAPELFSSTLTSLPLLSRSASEVVGSN